MAAQVMAIPQMGGAVIAGGPAGDHTVTGITANSVLLSVIRFVGAGVVVTDVAFLDAEFNVTAANTINNTGGTDTTGDKLLAFWV